MIMHETVQEGTVLIVDDVPENLSLLHDALDDVGYRVLVATNGESALQIARTGLPDVILLDVLMPGMDGYAAAHGLKAEFSTQHIPIIFMTGLSETESVVAAFASGGADYVTKPIRPREVLARIAAHMQNARQIRQARSALDTFGQATLSVRISDGQVSWQTPQARSLLDRYFGCSNDSAQGCLLDWIDKASQAMQEHREVPVMAEQEGQRLLGSLRDSGHEHSWLITLREENRTVALQHLATGFHLTAREAEVLYWVIYGKTNRDIGDILGSSHRTVNKHLEHIFEKLGVETRTSAAAVAMQKLRA